MTSAPGYARMATPKIRLTERGDGAFLLENETPLGPYPERLGDWLVRWAAETPDAVYLAERAKDGWRRITYAEAADRAARIASGLLDHGLGPERAVMLVAENGVDHALLMLGAYLAGVPIAPVSPGYAETGRDFTRLENIHRTLAPGLLVIDGAERFGAAAAALGRTPCLELGQAVETLGAHAPLGEKDAGITSAHVAKILFSSGSTGHPKGILNTHLMLTSNQAALAGCWPFLDEEKPVLVDWLPWSHTFGGNHNFHMVLRAGGTLYIDGGKPAPGLIETTLANLADISPTLYLNVPRGYDLLLGGLEADPDLAERFFANLVTMSYAGAGLPRALYDRLDALANRVLGHGVPIGTGWGTTETAPLATMTFFPGPQPPNIGVPAPGVTVKLAPDQGRFEIRVAGPNITPGYLGDQSLDEAAFDEEGFFRTGDAGLLADPANGAAGILFDGRLAENFKLDTGSWVTVGALRLATLSHLSPLIQDCVVTGEGRGEIGLMMFANGQACAAFDGAGLRAELGARLLAYNDANEAATTKIGRALILDDPPSVDAGEITDKGYVNQRAVLMGRADRVEALYDDANPALIRPQA